MTGSTKISQADFRILTVYAYTLATPTRLEGREQDERERKQGLAVRLKRKVILSTTWRASRKAPTKLWQL